MASKRKIGSLGDVNPIEYGGGFVFKSPGDTPWIEYTDGLSDGAEGLLPFHETRIDTFFERGDARVSLLDPDGNTIVEWVGDDVAVAIEDGFLDPHDWHESAYKYAKDTDLLEEHSPVTVYRVDVPDDIWKYHDWVDIDDISSTVGQGPEDVEKLGTSRKIMDRVWVLEIIASTWGWHELDHYPLQLTPKELEKRWRL